MLPGKTIQNAIRCGALLLGVVSVLSAAAQQQARINKSTGLMNGQPGVATSAPATDTVPHQKSKVESQGLDALYDTAFTDYDQLFSELDALLDSLYMPRSFGVVSAGLTQGYFNYSSANDTTVQTQKQFIYSASFGYYHKSGLGVSGGASLLNYDGGIRPFQYSLTGSFDYIRNKHFITGVAYTYFLTQSDLPFYTSPLQNEVYGYFTHRTLWFKPSVGVSYGWGSRSAYEERKEKVLVIKKKKVILQPGTVQVSSVERIADLSVNVSVRHDFFLLHPFGKKDYFRITPQIAMISGTQQFGFNQTTSSSPIGKGVGLGLNTSELYTSQNATLDNTMQFRPMSVTTYLKTEYVNHKFFIQPQVALDYYFPAQDNKLTASFLINAGLVF